MKCPHCAYELSKALPSCPGCGRELRYRQKNAPRAKAPDPQPAAAPAPAAKRPGTRKGKRRSKAQTGNNAQRKLIIAGILALVLLAGVPGFYIVTAIKETAAARQAQVDKETARSERRARLEAARDAVEAYLKGFDDEQAQLDEQYEHNLEECRTFMLLDAMRIASDPMLSDSRRILENMAKVRQEHEAAMQPLFQRMRDGFDPNDLDEPLRIEAADSFERQMTNVEKRLASNLEQDRKMADLAATIVDFLYARRGTWQVSGGMINFSDQADVNRYRALCNELDSLSLRLEFRQR